MSEANFQSKDLGNWMHIPVESFTAIPRDDSEWVQEMLNAGVPFLPGEYRVTRTLHYPCGVFRFVNGKWYDNNGGEVPIVMHKEIPVVVMDIEPSQEPCPKCGGRGGDCQWCCNGTVLSDNSLPSQSWRDRPPLL